MSNLIPFAMDGSTGRWKIANQDQDTHNGLAVVGVSPSAPSVSLGGAAGSGASVSVSGSNIGGIITFNSGTGILNAGLIFSLTFGGSFAFPTNCSVSLDPANSSAPLYPIYINSTSATGFSIGWTTGTTINTTLKWAYIIAGW